MRSECATRSNMSIDTDVLAAGFARLWPAGHFRRWAAWPAETDVSNVVRGAHLVPSCRFHFSGALVSARNRCHAEVQEKRITEARSESGVRRPRRHARASQGKCRQISCWRSEGSSLTTTPNKSVDTDALRRPPAARAPGASRRSPLR